MNNFTTTDPPDTLPLALVAVGASSSSSTGIRNPRKKRTKMMMMTIAEERPKPHKRPDPDAPKITRPCTECGKKFWSWKALFGHMRCHPERQWRGINPPPNLLRQKQQQQQQEQDHVVMTDKDYEVAECLLLLASGHEKRRLSECPGLHDEQFECSSCKKVFGSHQALGGHRASHKSVKGCFAVNIHAGATATANTNTSIAIIGDDGGGHKCSICLRVFSTGQALGGHKRCHWEKADTVSDTSLQQHHPVDLNLPPLLLTLEDHSSSSSSPLALDLRLGL